MYLSNKFVRPAMLLLSLFSAMSFALPDDRGQPIQIKADSAERDERQGTTTYRGDVTIDQGSMNISGDEVIFYGSREVTKIIAKGQPARLRQQPDSDKPVMKARANSITYEVLGQNVELKKQAVIEQEGSIVRGSRIFYDIDQQIIKADNEGKSNNRVHITIPAQVTQKDGQQ